LLTLFSITSLHTAELVIVVDDIGYNLARAERLLNIPGKLTLGLFPFAPHS